MCSGLILCPPPPPENTKLKRTHSAHHGDVKKIAGPTSLRRREKAASANVREEKGLQSPFTKQQARLGKLASWVRIHCQAAKTPLGIPHSLKEVCEYSQRHQLEESPVTRFDVPPFLRLLSAIAFIHLLN